MSAQYPKFLLKGESKLLGGNMTIAIEGESEECVILIITIFDSTGTKHFDSLSIAAEKHKFKLAIQQGNLISILEDLYLAQQVRSKNFNIILGEFYVH